MDEASSGGASSASSGQDLLDFEIFSGNHNQQNEIIEDGADVAGDANEGGGGDSQVVIQQEEAVDLTGDDDLMLQEHQVQQVAVEPAVLEVAAIRPSGATRRQRQGQPQQEQQRYQRRRIGDPDDDDDGDYVPNGGSARRDPHLNENLTFRGGPDDRRRSPRVIQRELQRELAVSRRTESGRNIYLQSLGVGDVVHFQPIPDVGIIQRPPTIVMVSEIRYDVDNVGELEEVYIGTRPFSGWPPCNMFMLAPADREDAIPANTHFNLGEVNLVSGLLDVPLDEIVRQVEVYRRHHGHHANLNAWQEHIMGHVVFFNAVANVRIELANEGREEEDED